MLAVLQPDILLHCMCAQLCLFVIPWTIASQPPLSMRFPRQEYWSGLSFPSPGDLPSSGIELVSPESAGGFSITEPPGKPMTLCSNCLLTCFSLSRHHVLWRQGPYTSCILVVCPGYDLKQYLWKKMCLCAWKFTYGASSDLDYFVDSENKWLTIYAGENEYWCMSLFCMFCSSKIYFSHEYI